jgi:hypothetical protein
MWLCWFKHKYPLYWKIAYVKTHTHNKMWMLVRKCKRCGEDNYMGIWEE